MYVYVHCKAIFRSIHFHFHKMFAPHILKPKSYVILNGEQLREMYIKFLNK